MALKSVPTFHDSRYLYIGLLAFSDGSSELRQNELEQRIRSGIQEYVTEQQLRYQLAERTSTYQKIPAYITSELSSYGLFKRMEPGEIIQLTDAGKNLLDLLLKRQGVQVRVQLAAHYLTTFASAAYFLDRVWILSEKPGLKLPEVSYAALTPLKQRGVDALPQVIEEVADEIATTLADNKLISFSPELFISACVHKLKDHDWRSESKQKSFQAMRRVVDNYMLKVNFPQQEISRPKYDVLRNRGDSFGLVNQRRLAGTHLTWEHTYLTSWLLPPMEVPRNIRQDDLLTARVKESTLHVHEPRWDSIRDRFLNALRDAYKRFRMPLGYARVVDIREDVCYVLRIQSRTFDEFIKRIADLDQTALTFSTSPERYTTRSLPLYLAKGRTYNLIRVS
jgi:hypothetical protein